MAAKRKVGPVGTGKDLESYLAEEAAKLEATRLLARLDVTKELADRASALRAVEKTSAALKKAMADAHGAQESKQAANEALREILAPLVASGCPISLVTDHLGVPAFLCRPRSLAAAEDEEEAGAPAPTPIRPERSSDGDGAGEVDPDLGDDVGEDWLKDQLSAS